MPIAAIREWHSHQLPGANGIGFENSPGGGQPRRERVDAKFHPIQKGHRPVTAGSPKSFRLFAVVALKRPDLSETVIAWRRDEGQARRLAGQYMVAVAHEFVRCRV